jgi:hypothetical protein
MSTARGRIGNTRTTVDSLVSAAHVPLPFLETQSAAPKAAYFPTRILCLQRPEADPPECRERGRLGACPPGVALRP